MDAGLLPKRLNDMTFSDTAPTDHDQVGPAANKIAGGQFFQLHPVKGLGVEVPVEGFQGFVLGKAGLADATSHGAFAARIGLVAQQPIEKAQMRRALFLARAEKFIERRRFRAGSAASRSGSGSGHAIGRLVMFVVVLPWFPRLAPFPPAAL